MDKSDIQKLREQYMNNPPDGMTKKLVQGMSESDLLDMHFHLSEFDEIDDSAFAPLFDLSELCQECQQKLIKKFQK